MSLQAKDEVYKDPEAMAMDFAAAVNAEAHDLVRAGADVIQLDEPWGAQRSGRRAALCRESHQPRP
jgi:methionine synthase II (cobalamin-independent)